MSGPFRGRIASPEAFQAAFGVSRETLDRLRIYEALLRTWQETLNLVSPATLSDLWHRHFADSAQLLDLGFSSPPSGLPCKGEGKGARGGEGQGGKSWLDLGSGAGFPGLVLGIMLAERDPCARVTLVESDQRKAAFLGEVARKTGAAVEILAERSEKAATQATSRRPDVVTARAVASLPKLLGLALPFFSPSTVGLFPKGRDVEIEVNEARKRFAFDLVLAPSRTDEAGRVVIVRDLSARLEG